MMAQSVRSSRFVDSDEATPDTNDRSAKEREERLHKQRLQAQNSPLAQQLNDLMQVLHGLTEIVSELEQRMTHYVPATDDVPSVPAEPVPGPRGTSAPVSMVHTLTLEFIEQGERIRRILHAIEL